MRTHSITVTDRTILCLRWLGRSCFLGNNHCITVQVSPIPKTEPILLLIRTSSTNNWITKDLNVNAVCSPIRMPSGHPIVENATFVSELFWLLIRLRAAKKLTGIAKRVPNVVASRARKTVSMILSQVLLATSENSGFPMLRRGSARINWATSTGCASEA